MEEDAERIFDDLSLLVRREKDQDEAIEKRRSISPRNNNTEVADRDRDETVSWLFEVFRMEKTWPLEVFVRSAVILDRFLSACCNIKRTQLQLASVSCCCLAFKLRESQSAVEDFEEKLISYTDESVTSKEVKVKQFSLMVSFGWSLLFVQEIPP